MSTKATSCPVTVYFQFLGGGVSLVLAGLQAQPVSTHHTYSWAFFVWLSCPCTPFPWTLLCGALLSLHPLHHWICFSRSLEQEISFDFGPHGEFAYLYSQCYELTTNEYILALMGGVGGARCREEGTGQTRSYSPYLRSPHWGTESGLHS